MSADDAGIAVDVSGLVPRAARRRDRRGRGVRGPGVVPIVPGQPALRTPGERFDDLVLDIADELASMLGRRLPLVEYAVEDAPVLPPDWAQGNVPLSSLIRGHGRTPTRIVLFRRPIERRCATRVELEAMVLTVVVEQVAELLGVRPEDIDPRYEP